jgi:hypothetical protein
VDGVNCKRSSEVFLMTPSSSRRWAALVLGVALTFGPSSPVLALTPAPANAEAMTPAQRAEWERLRAEGKAAAQTREWMKALKAYEGAWLIHKDWNLAANLGKMELNLGKQVEAAGHLEYAVREAPKNLATDAPDEWAALGELQRKARAKVGALVINVEPAGAEVLVNGLAVGKAPLPGSVFVLPGAVTVEARAEGFTLGSAPTQAVAGNEQKVSLALVAIPGAKRVDLVKGPGPVGSGSPPPVVPPKRSVLPAVVMGAVGGVAAIVGVSLYGAGRGKKSSIDQLYLDAINAGQVCTDSPPSGSACEKLYNGASTGNMLQRAGVGMLIGAGALGAATVIYLVIPQSAEAPRTNAFWVAPEISTNGGAVIVTGTF